MRKIVNVNGFYRSTLNYKLPFVYCVILLLILMSGCLSGKYERKPEEQINKSVLIRKASKPGLFVIGGDTLSDEDILSIPIPQNDGGYVLLSEALAPAAQQYPMEEYKNIAKETVERYIQDEVLNILFLGKYFI